MKGLDFECQILENRIKNKIKDADGIEGVANWRTQIRTAFDKTSFRDKYPEICQGFTSEQQSRVFKLF